MPFKFPGFDRTIKVLLGLLALSAVVVALFDWNWFRHPVERYLTDQSHREVRIGDLHVDIGFSLEPTVRVRDVYIENAPWADKRPFLTAREGSFTGAVLTGPVLTFLQTGESFPMRGRVSAGKSRLEVDGTIADMFNPSSFDAKVHLAGPSLSNLQAFFRRSLPASRPYDFQARVRQTKQETVFAELSGKIGDSDLAGDISIDRGKERLTVRAALGSGFADLADLRSLAQGHRSTDKAGPEEVATEETGAAAKDSAPDNPQAVPPKRLFSDHVFDATGLKKLDAHATLEIKKFKVTRLRALESLRLTADLRDGVLALKPIDIGLAGGHVVGQMTFDGQRNALSAHAKIDLKDVRLEQLLAEFSTGTKAPKGAGSLHRHI